MRLRVLKLGKSQTVTQTRPVDHDLDDGVAPFTVVIGTLVTYQTPSTAGKPRFIPADRDFESTVRAGQHLAILHEEEGKQDLWTSSKVCRITPTRTGWTVRTQNSVYLVESADGISQQSSRQQEREYIAQSVLFDGSKRTSVNQLPEGGVPGGGRGPNGGDP